ncbi:pyrroline-5-carboxylate reductase 1, mitochondrial [Microplitis demolitor]|uniref:pyrroline-5-carboxylate reductase 1, mitochondrial n=1 Tax=Microplitis demolitor TaxID=69319 RepID=UPI0004CD390D|nr:pyrroline-5-carboxylate reductase 1, mitochondrial [Microplitis demolitor]
MKIGFFGGGKMAQALAKGFIKAGLCKGDSLIASCLPSDLKSKQAFETIGSKVVFLNKKVAEHGDVLIISVKPQVVDKILPEIKTCDKLIISIAAGTSIDNLEKNLPKGTPVIRLMPNLPVSIGYGATVFKRGSFANDQHADLVKKLFTSMGICEEIDEDESVLDTVTALAGSGPAYVYMMIESLADGAVKMGMSRQLAYKLATQTVLGAGAMVNHHQNISGGCHPAQLKDDVASPAGSTITAIHHLEKYGMRSAVIGAIEVATLACRTFSKK